MPNKNNVERNQEHARKVKVITGRPGRPGEVEVHGAKIETPGKPKILGAPEIKDAEHVKVHDRTHPPEQPDLNLKVGVHDTESWNKNVKEQP